MTIEKLLEAIDDDDINTVQYLLKKGVDSNIYVDDFGSLTDAILGQQDNMIGIVKLLLEYGAKANMCLQDKTTPLQLAVLYGNIDVVKMLLDEGADPNIAEELDGLGFPLLIALDLNHNMYNIVILLLNFGAQATINYSSSLCGCTPLSKAAKTLNLKLIDILLKYGASTASLDEDGYTPQQNLPKKDTLNEKSWNKAFKLLSTRNLEYIEVSEKLNRYIFSSKKNNILANVNKDNHYLYCQFEISCLLVWSAKNDLLIESVKEVVFLMLESTTTSNLEKIMSSTIGDILLTDYYLDKEFIMSYLAVTKWFYSFYYDLKKLYPEEHGLIEPPRTMESYQQILKLLDKRYEQFKSRKHFNSNQSETVLRSLLT